MLFRLTTFVVLLLSAGSALAQFEGIVESKNVTTDESGNTIEYVMTIWLRKDMATVKTTSAGSVPGITMIYRNDKRIVWMVNDEEKSYMEISQDEPAEEHRSPLAGDEKYKVRRTGKSKKILAYRCEQILLTKGDERTEIWATKKLQSLNRTLAGALGDERAQVGAWDDELAKLGVYPLSAKVKVGGHIVEAQEVTRVEEKKLTDDVFEVPSGFSKQDAERMFEETGKERN